MKVPSAQLYTTGIMLYITPATFPTIINEWKAAHWNAFFPYPWKTWLVKGEQHAVDTNFFFILVNIIPLFLIKFEEASYIPDLLFERHKTYFSRCWVNLYTSYIYFLNIFKEKGNNVAWLSQTSGKRYCERTFSCVEEVGF